MILVLEEHRYSVTPGNNASLHTALHSPTVPTPIAAIQRTRLWIERYLSHSAKLVHTYVLFLSIRLLRFHPLYHNMATHSPPQPLQGTQNRYSNASSNLGPGQTQSPQSAEATSTQSFQQHCTSNTTHPTSNFQNSIHDVYIAVMGITGSGKSTFVSICSQKIVPIGHGLRSSQLIHPPHSELAYWQELYTIVTKTVQSYSFMLSDSIQVHLLDTPGFDDTERDDFTVLGDVASYLYKTYRQGIQLRGIIYCHKIDDNRVRGKQ